MNGVEITGCPPHDATQALQVLLASLPDRERDALVQSLEELLQHGATTRRGLLVARDERGLRGAVFAQEQPGRTAVLWMPGTQPPDALVERRLAEAADEYLGRGGIVMAQTLSARAENRDCELLRHIGYERLTELQYMLAPTRPARRGQLSAELRFEPYRPSERSRLGALIEATYADAEDCPELNGVRDMDDVITGYESTGSFDPRRWYFVAEGEADVGVLLVTEHGPARQWELMYMALVPQARGRGLGTSIVRFALDQGHAAGTDGVLLAVDVRNRAGLGLYRKCGFQVWDRRTVFWKRYI